MDIHTGSNGNGHGSCKEILHSKIKNEANVDEVSRSSTCSCRDPNRLRSLTANSTIEVDGVMSFG